VPSADYSTNGKENQAGFFVLVQTKLTHGTVRGLLVPEAVIADRAFAGANAAAG
jgi:hypothetical protein